MFFALNMQIILIFDCFFIIFFFITQLFVDTAPLGSYTVLYSIVQLLFKCCALIRIFDVRFWRYINNHASLYSVFRKIAFDFKLGLFYIYGILHIFCTIRLSQAKSISCSLAKMQICCACCR